MAKEHFGGFPWEIVEAVSGRWIVLLNGFQWGDGPYDKSGCSSQTWATRKDALEAIREQLAF